MTTKFQAIHALVGGRLSGPSDGSISEYAFQDGQTPPTEKAIKAKSAASEHPDIAFYKPRKLIKIICKV